MTTLADLKHDKWTAVARYVWDRTGEYVSEWGLSPYERGAFNKAVESKQIITAKKRGADGIMRLWAILAPLGRKLPVVPFDDLGKGMFEE